MYSVPRQSTKYSLATCHPLQFVSETEGQNQDVAEDQGVSVTAQSEYCRGTSVKCSAESFLLLTMGHPNHTARGLVAEFGARPATAPAISSTTSIGKCHTKITSVLEFHHHHLL